MRRELADPQGVLNNRDDRCCKRICLCSTLRNWSPGRILDDSNELRQDIEEERGRRESRGSDADLGGGP